METVNLFNVFPKDKLIKYDTKNYPFSDVLSKLFSVTALEKIHCEVDNLNGFDGDLGRDSQSIIHDMFYKTIKNEDSILRKLWDSFLIEEVLQG